MIQSVGVIVCPAGMGKSMILMPFMSRVTPTWIMNAITAEDMLAKSMVARIVGALQRGFVSQRNGLLDFLAFHSQKHRSSHARQDGDIVEFVNHTGNMDPVGRFAGS